MKYFLLLYVFLFSSLSYAGWGVFVGGLSSAEDSKSFASTAGLSIDHVTCYEFGGFYEYGFSPMFGVRGGLEIQQVGFSNTYSASSPGTLTYKTSNLAIPLLLDWHVASVFSLLLGGEYWIRLSSSGSLSGSLVASGYTFTPNSSGIVPRVGLGLSFGPHLEVSLNYIPDWHIVTSLSGSSVTATEYGADLGYKF